MDESLESKVEFADNAEPRCPVVLLLDTSSSMSGEPIKELCDGVRILAEELRKDALASLRVELSIVRFGGDVEAVDVRGAGAPIGFDANQAFATAIEFVCPFLRASGGTPMGGGMRRAISLLTERKAIYRAAGIDYFRPWIVLISDGEPTDTDWESAARQSRAEEDRGGVIVFPIGVNNANMRQLGQFSQRSPILLNGLDFRELFLWVSRSLKSVSGSKPGKGDMVPLEPVGWGVVPS